MQITLTDQRVKALAKSLRARLPQDPGQRRTLDMLAESLGHASYGALKTALAAEAGQPDPDALPPLLRLLDRTPSVDASDGSWIWRQFADVDNADEIARVLGLEVAVRTLDSDPGESAADFEARLDAYHKDRLADLPKLTEWRPTPPEGDGWTLAGQHEHEDGHAALFVRAPQGGLDAGPDPRAAVEAAGRLAEIERIAEGLEEFGDDPDARGKGALIRELAQAVRPGDAAGPPASGAPSEVHVAIVEGDGDKFVWAALDADAALASAIDYIAETMGPDADVPYEVFRAELLGDDDAAPETPEDARSRRTVRADWLDPHGNLVEGASGPIHEVLAKTVRFLEAMAADGLAAHVRLHGREATLSDADLVEVAPGFGSIEHPWFGYADMTWGPQGRKCFQTRLDLPDWREIEGDGENAGPSFKVTADYFYTGVRFTFEHADGTLQEMLLENSQGRPKINTWSEFEQDSDAIVLIERDGTLVTAGAGDGTYKYVAGGDVRRAPIPET